VKPVKQQWLAQIGKPFSILKRIVMGETEVGDAADAGGGVFQYPQADRDG